MTTWPSIYSIFKRNIPDCPEDGAYAEGYSDAVVVMLVKHWNNLVELQKIFKNDPSSKNFVLMHIDASSDPDDLRTVLWSAEAKCPRDSSGLSKEIASRVGDALSF